MAEQIFEKLAAEFREHLPHHGQHPASPATRDDIPVIRADEQSQAPADQPVNLAAAAPAAAPTEKEPPMLNLTSIAADIKGAVENADQWVKEITETHLPAVVAIAQRYEGSPIVQALETAVLPPEVEEGIAGTIRELAKLYPAPAAAPAGPAQPAAAVPAGQ